MATMDQLSVSSLLDLRGVCWRTGDMECAELVLQELLRRIATGHIIDEDVMCWIMNRHRDMTTGKERSWHKGRKTYGRKTKEVEDAYWANNLEYHSGEVY
jgi:hypothetical protein